MPAWAVRHAFDLLQRSYDVFVMFDGLDLQNTTVRLFATSVFIFSVAILISALLRGVFMFFMRQTIIVMSRHIEYDLKNEIYAHYQTLPLSFYRRNNTGDLMARISEDVSKVRMYIGPAIMYGINLFTLFLMVIPFMFTINPTLTIYSLIPLPLLSISIYFVNNIINQRSEQIQKSLSDLSTFVQEAFSGIRVIKAFSRENEVAQSFEKESNTYKEKSLRLVLVDSLFFPLIMGLIGLSVILTVYVGGIEVFNGQVTTGNIAEFIIYVNMLTWPVASLGWITSIIQRAAASQKRVNEFLNTKNDIISEEGIVTKIRGDLHFENVSFVYPDSGIKALKAVSFHIPAGESLAIIGTTGSGKSTIANLICRLYDVSEGQILVDGRDLRDYDIASHRSQVGYVPQDIFLFSDTIANNIAFGNPNLSKAEIEKAAKDADLLDNLAHFPKGFETRVGERGITLSGGQKQRVSIARAIATSPSIMILDDALSAVDTKTENAILNAMAKIMVDRTSIIITHRVSSTKLADRIVVLDDGEIIEKGSYEELLEKNGVFRELFNKQVAGEEEIAP